MFSSAEEAQEGGREAAGPQEGVWVGALAAGPAHLAGGEAAWLLVPSHGEARWLVACRPATGGGRRGCHAVERGGGARVRLGSRRIRRSWGGGDIQGELERLPRSAGHGDLVGGGDSWFLR